jgi:transposase
VRVSTAFNRILQVPGAWVDSVEFTEAGIVVGLRRRQRQHVCPCGRRSRARYDLSRRRWRHLDMGRCAVWLEADIARVDCRRCSRVRTEQVPWARSGARLTRDVEDVIAWLAQRTDKTSICRLLRVSWQTVHRTVSRVVADHLDDSRLDNLYRLGVDEISYKRGHHYLTVIANHDNGRVVWVAKGRNHRVLQGFFDALGPDRCAQVEAISMDMAKVWQQPCADNIPQAAVCFDPFHVIRWANEALNSVYRATAHQRPANSGGREWSRTRYALYTGAERLDAARRQLINALRRSRYGLWRAWELKERLRDLYHRVDPTDAVRHLRAWCSSAVRSRLKPFVNLARRIRVHFDGIVASVELGLSNSRLEGINAKIRLINKRGYGHPNYESLTAMIHLCLGDITIPLPTER